MPLSNTKLLAKLLRSLASQLDKLEGDDFEITVVAPKHVRELQSAQKTSRKKELSIDQHYIDETLQLLSNVKTREQATKILDQRQLTRRELESLCIKFNMRSSKQDNMERLTERLIEALIGSRLNAEAIRGKLLGES